VGLGLAIAREFAEAHGGRIDVLPESRGGHFRLTLPKRGYGEVAEAA
jgi:two-component system sensor histidine kinase GlrK